MEALSSKVIAIRVNKALGDRLEAQAARENNHVSAVTRRLLTVALDHEDASRSLPSRPRRRRS